MDKICTFFTHLHISTNHNIFRVNTLHQQEIKQATYLRTDCCKPFTFICTKNNKKEYISFHFVRQVYFNCSAEIFVRKVFQTSTNHEQLKAVFDNQFRYKTLHIQVALNIFVLY